MFLVSKVSNFLLPRPYLDIFYRVHSFKKTLDKLLIMTGNSIKVQPKPKDCQLQMRLLKTVPLLIFEIKKLLSENITYLKTLTF